MGKDFRMVAKTLFGFEEVLEAELLALGAKNVEKGNRFVAFTGSQAFMYDANLNLRTALRILKPIGSFTAATPDELYQKAGRLPWASYLNNEMTFAVNATANSELFTHSHYAALKVKDAIADTFMRRSKSRPSVDTRFPDVLIDLHVQNRRCTISLDSSGASLHQRGYRQQTNSAPLNEVLAAGLLLQAGWKGQSHFFDPMCGSGTLAIEAAFIARNLPPNGNRKRFGFENWLDFDEPLFDQLRKEALGKGQPFDYKIFAADRAASAMQKSKMNINNAGFSQIIKLDRADFFTAARPSEEDLFLAFNAPYGERLPIDEKAFFKQIGDTLKGEYQGCEAWILLGDPGFAKLVGLRTSRKIKFYNGKLECRLANYSMYRGSKKKSNEAVVE